MNLKVSEEEIYLAGGCLWGVQEFIRHIPGVFSTEAGRANGSTNSHDVDYDGYAECVRTSFNPVQLELTQLIEKFFEIIDPYSLNQQGPDVGKKYRTGIYSKEETHLKSVRKMIETREDSDQIVVEVLPLTSFLPSREEHQFRLKKNPKEKCHIPPDLLFKYRSENE